jgi:hypothetical protein
MLADRRDEAPATGRSFAKKIATATVTRLSVTLPRERTR